LSYGRITLAAAPRRGRQQLLQRGGL